MEIPFEVLTLIIVLSFALSIIGAWKKIPFTMVIGGALMTFIFIMTDSITALGDTQTCTTASATTTCTFQPYVLDMWAKIIMMLVGTILMIGGALIWKTMED